MAYAEINFVNPNTGVSKTAPVGFSWTTFIFAFFPAFIRGHVVGGLIILLSAVLLAVIGTTIMAFVYNKMYIKYLISEGFEAVSASQELEHLQARLGINLPQSRNSDKQISNE